MDFGSDCTTFELQIQLDVLGRKQVGTKIIHVEMNGIFKAVQFKNIPLEKLGSDIFLFCTVRKRSVQQHISKTVIQAIYTHSNHLGIFLPSFLVSQNIV